MNIRHYNICVACVLENIAPLIIMPAFREYNISSFIFKSPSDLKIKLLNEKLNNKNTFSPLQFAKKQVLNKLQNVHPLLFS